MRCSLCAKPCRKRTAVMAVNPGTGKIGRMLVCQDCASQGVIFVPSTPINRCTCSKPATLCTSCAADRARRPDALQKEIAKKLRAMASGYKARSGEHGRIDGLEQAADLVEGWTP